MRVPYTKITTFLYYTLKILILVGLVFSLARQEWGNSVLIALIFSLTFAPTLFKAKYRLYFPIEFDFFIIAYIFLALFLGDMQDYYTKFWWWDLYLHSGSGFLLGMVGFVLSYTINEQKSISLDMKPGYVALFAFGFSMTIASIWEIFEFTMDQMFGLTMQQSGIVDTMWDLIVAMIGAIIISILGYLWMKKKISFFVFDRSIKKFVRKNKHLFHD
jgi:uncharacterized membrane protein